MAQHLNIVGLRASGQSTVVDRLVRRNNGERVKRVTDRPVRPGESNDYIHMERLELVECIDRGEILEGTLRSKVEQSRGYVTGVLIPEKWQLSPRVKLIVSMFGTASLLVKEILKDKYHIDMFNVYLFVPPWIRRERLAKKEALTGVSFEADRQLLAKQPSQEEWEQLAQVELLEARRAYDHVVVNDGTVEECVENIENYFQLTRRKKKALISP